MRIPHTIPQESVRAYESSEQVLGLIAERNRKLSSEVWNWDTNIPPTLVELVIVFFANNFEHHKNVLPLFNQEILILFLEVLSTSIALDIAIPYVNDGIHWKRRCNRTWPQASDVTRYDGSWRRMFIEKYIETFIENEEPGYTDWNELRGVFSICSPYIKRLEISHLQPPRVMELPPVYPDFCSTENFVPEHLDMCPILTMLENLEELNLKFSVKDIGMKFKFNYFTVNIKDIERLCVGLKCLIKLKVLRISCSDIDDNKLAILLKGLEVCQEFNNLEITHCKISDSGAKCLAYFIQIRPSIKFLKLHNNTIGSEGTQGLAYSMTMETGCKLDSLDLRFNPIGSEGGRYLATALAKSRHIQHVKLAGCGLGPEAGVDISNMLRINKSLVELDLSNNQLGGEVGELVAVALKSNFIIFRLDVRNCGFTNECMKKIQELALRNREKIRKIKDNRDDSDFYERRGTPFM